VTIAQSKYLGGDIEHTHLVKGLDFALLQKTRADLSASEASVAAERKAAAEKVAAPKAVGRNRSAAASRPIGTAAMPPPPLPSGCGISWEWRCVLWQVGWLLLLPGQRPSIAVGHTSRACRATMLAPHQRRWRRPAAPNGDLPHPGPSGLWLPAAVRDGARPGCTLRGYWPSVGPNPPLDRRFGCDNGLVAVEAGRSAACGQGVLYLASVHMDDVFDVMSRCVLQAVGLGRGGVDAS
jgi:hypothetical protein